MLWTPWTCVNAVCRLIALMLIATLPAIAPYSAIAATINVSLQGVLVQDVTGGCITFEGDDGATYFLSTLGGFAAGDRVHVTGSYNDTQAGVCFNTAAFQITVTQLRPTFAGVGTISVVGEKTRLVTDDGRTFVLQNTGGFRSGARAYAQGTVTASRTTWVLSGNTIGPAFSEFGRITSLAPGALRFTSESGAVYSLDRPGSINGVFEGDAVFVEGIRGRLGAGGVTPLTSVTARPAFHASGRIAQGGGFAPDTLILGDQYTASAIAGTPVGTKVYLRGRSADDYDFGEFKPVRNIRLSRADISYTALGILDTASRTVTNYLDNTVIHLEHIGNPFLNPSGSLVYIAGAVASEGFNTVTLSHNEVRIGIIQEGVLLNGFGCTPIIRFDNGGYIFPKNNGGLPVNTRVRVTGGFTFQVPCNDEYGMVDNTIEASPNQCPNCE